MRKYKPQLDKLVLEENEPVGFVTYDPERYWSRGYSVSLGELESIIVKYSDPCVRSISESHRRANSLAKSTS